MAPPTRWMMGGSALATIAFVALPAGSRPRLAVYLAAALVALIVALVALRRLTGPPRRAWAVLVAGLASYVLADVGLTGWLVLTGEVVQMGSPVHLAYPLGAVLLAVGVMRTIERGRARDRALLIDALVATTGVAVLAVLVLVIPSGDAVADTLVGRVQLVAYPIAHLLLLAATTSTLLGDRQPVPAGRWLLAGLSTLLATVVVLGVLVATERYAIGGILDLGWLVGYAMIARAAIDPGAAAAVHRPTVEQRTLSKRRALALAAAAALLPVTGLLVARRPTDVVLAAATGFVLLLVTLRVWLLLRELEHSRDAALTQQRERERHRLEALLQYASDAVLVLTDGRVAYATPSATELLGADPQGWSVDLLRQRVLGSLPAGLPRQPGVVVASRFTDATGQVRHVEIVETDRTRDPDVRGIVVTLHETTERTTLEAELRHLAFHDPLTGLSNRQLFLDRLEHARSRTLRGPGHQLAVLILDLDDFKSVNDTLGHAAGDRLLIEVGRRMRDQLRDADTVARLGGDEFAVLCEDVTDAVDAGITARRLLEAIRQPVHIDGHELQVGTSIGVTVDDGRRGGDELLRDADIALYEAKADGKQRWAMHHHTMTVRAQQRTRLTGELAETLADDGIEVVFQPIVALSTLDPDSMEALARWNHPTRGPVPPAEFITLAEDGGLVPILGQGVLRRALASLAGWLAKVPDSPITVSVNVSGRQFRDSGLVRTVERELVRAGLAAERLMLELTESVMLDDTDQTQGVMRELRGRGVRFSIDDFGTGYSSLAYLHRLPVDRVKIDRRFIAGLGTPGGADDLVRAIIDLGRSLRLEVVAEGVETEVQRAALTEMGCTYGQGYLFARPTDQAGIAAWLASRPMDRSQPVTLGTSAP